MKNKTRFLSLRVRWAFAAFFGVCALLLAALAAACAGRGGLWIALAGAGLLALIGYAFDRLVYRPFLETERMMELFADGYTLQGVSEQRYAASPAHAAAFAKLREFLAANDLIGATKRQAQYLALQNQINPHFLYNTLEGIRGEALAAGMDNVAEMTEALATFFRYTISNVENLVTLEEELQNIENYCIIQRYRFGERLNLSIECDEQDRAELYACKLPKLTLQPIVENSIVHGIERKVGRGNLCIRIEGTKKRLLITVSDDGVGMPADTLAALSGRLSANGIEYVHSGSARGGIALVNVQNRIRLLFGEEYGLCVQSTPGVGTDVEITLPRDSWDAGALS